MPISKLRPSFTLTEDRLKELQAVVPEAFADGRINWDTLREALGETLEDETKEHFGLFWPGKREARRLAAMPSKGTLIPQPGQGVDEDNTHNLFIEGDNLEVLKLLQKSYAGRVKVIYIDPPYNTGNDFVYPDDYSEPLESYFERIGQVDEEGRLLTTNSRASGRFHSRWLSMMYPRILLARQLLCEDGVMVVHIDENEYTNLELMLAEVFGEENNLGTVVWDKRNPKGEVTGVAQQHELISIYCKNKSMFAASGNLSRKKENAEAMLKKAASLIKVADGVNHEVRASYKKWLKERKNEFSGGELAYSEIDENGDVYQPVSMAAPDKPETRSHRPLVHPISGENCPVPAKGWRFPDKTMDDLLRRSKILFGADETTQPRQKYLLRENIRENLPSLLYFGGSGDALDVPFDNPKPLKVSMMLVDAVTNKGKIDIILDFFAGSCTTAHAVLQQNREDGGRRQFIMVQLPEPTPLDSAAREAGYATIAEIGKERIRRVIRKLHEEKIVQVSLPEGTPEDLDVKSLKLIHSHFTEWQPYTERDSSQLELRFTEAESPLVPDWQPENLLAEILLLQGFPLVSRVKVLPEFKANKVKQVISEFVGHHLYICLDKNIKAETVAKIDIRPEDILVCLDSALSDEAKVKLADQCNLKVI